MGIYIAVISVTFLLAGCSSSDLNKDRKLWISIPQDLSGHEEKKRENKFFSNPLRDKTFPRKLTKDTLNKISELRWNELEGINEFLNIQTYFRKNYFNKNKHFDEIKVTTNKFGEKEIENAAINIIEQVKVAEPKDTLLSFGSDDGFIIYVNGDSVAGRYRPRGNHEHDDLIEVHLDEGVNYITYRIDQRFGNWSVNRSFYTLSRFNSFYDYNLVYTNLPVSSIVEDSQDSINLHPSGVHMDVIPKVEVQ
jgi:hypothetical protein